MEASKVSVKSEPEEKDCCDITYKNVRWDDVDELSLPSHELDNEESSTCVKSEHLSPKKEEPYTETEIGSKACLDLAECYCKYEIKEEPMEILEKKTVDHDYKITELLAAASANKSKEAVPLVSYIGSKACLDLAECYCKCEIKEEPMEILEEKPVDHDYKITELLAAASANKSKEAVPLVSYTAEMSATDVCKKGIAQDKGNSTDSTESTRSQIPVALQISQVCSGEDQVQSLLAENDSHTASAPKRKAAPLDTTAKRRKQCLSSIVREVPEDKVASGKKRHTAKRNSGARRKRREEFQARLYAHYASSSGSQTVSVPDQTVTSDAKIFSEHADGILDPKSRSAGLVYPHCACACANSQDKWPGADERLKHVHFLHFMNKRLLTFIHDGQPFISLLELRALDMLPPYSYLLKFLCRLFENEVMEASAAEMNLLQKMYLNFEPDFLSCSLVTPIVLHMAYKEAVQRRAAYAFLYSAHACSMFYLQRYNHTCPWTIIITPTCELELPSETRTLRKPRILRPKGKQEAASPFNKPMTSSVREALQAVINLFGLKDQVHLYCNCDFTTGERMQLKKGKSPYHVGHMLFLENTWLHCWIRPKGIFVSMHELCSNGLLPWRSEAVTAALQKSRYGEDRSFLTVTEANFLRGYLRPDHKDEKFQYLLISVKFLPTIYESLIFPHRSFANHREPRFFIKLLEDKCPDAIDTKHSEETHTGSKAYMKVSGTEEPHKASQPEATKRGKDCSNVSEVQPVQNNTLWFKRVRVLRSRVCSEEKLLEILQRYAARRRKFRKVDYSHACNCQPAPYPLKRYSFQACSTNQSESQSLFVHETFGKAVLLPGKLNTVLCTIWDDDYCYFNIGDLVDKGFFSTDLPWSKIAQLGLPHCLKTSSTLVLQLLESHKVSVKKTPSSSLFINAELLCYVTPLASQGTQSLDQSGIHLLQLGHVCKDPSSVAYMLATMSSEKGESSVSERPASLKVMKSTGSQTEAADSCQSQKSSPSEAAVPVTDSPRDSAATDSPAQKGDNIVLRAIPIVLDLCQMKKLLNLAPFEFYTCKPVMTDKLSPRYNMSALLKAVSNKLQMALGRSDGKSISQEDLMFEGKYVKRISGTASSNMALAAPLEISESFVKVALGEDADKYWVVLTGTLTFKTQDSELKTVAALKVGDDVYINWSTVAAIVKNSEIIYTEGCLLNAHAFVLPASLTMHLSRKQTAIMNDICLKNPWVPVSLLQDIYNSAVGNDRSTLFPQTYASIRHVFVEQTPESKYEDFVLIKF